jgi:hypothetical protein
MVTTSISDGNGLSISRWAETPTGRMAKVKPHATYGIFQGTPLYQREYLADTKPTE